MNILFTVGGSQATVFGVAPLAGAARNRGHEVLLTADEPLMDAATSVGLPAVCITPERMRYGQEAMTASTRLDALLELSKVWRPDVIVGGLSHVPRALAAFLDVPYIRQVWHIPAMSRRDKTAQEELKPELQRLVLGDLPDPALFVNLCPPSLRPPDAPAAQSMRWVPRVRQRRLEPWMYTRAAGRRRVLVTAGTRNLTLDTPGTSLQDLVKQLTAGGAEVLIAALPEIAAKCAAELGDARIGWIPLDVVAPSCDLAVHHGGATTAATLLNSGVPQLVLPDNGYGRAVGEAMARFGAAVVLEPRGLATGQESHHAISEACLEILSTEHFGTRAMDLASEIASLPTADAVVDQIEEHVS